MCVWPRCFTWVRVCHISSRKSKLRGIRLASSLNWIVFLRCVLRNCISANLPVALKLLFTTAVIDSFMDRLRLFATVLVLRLSCVCVCSLLIFFHQMEVEQRFPRMQLVRKAAEQYQRLILERTRPTMAVVHQVHTNKNQICIPPLHTRTSLPFLFN